MKRTNGGWFGRLGLFVALAADFAADRMQGGQTVGLAVATVLLLAGGVIFILFWRSE